MGIELQATNYTSNNKRVISVGDLLNFLDAENEKFEELNLTEEDVTALLDLMRKRHPEKVSNDFTVDVSTLILQRTNQRQAYARDISSM